MPSNFNTVSNGQTINAIDVNQFAQPILNLEAAMEDKEDKSQRGAPNGYASLNSSGKVPIGQIPVDELPTGGGGASELDDLTDVAISSPAPGQALRYNGTEFTNSAMGISDVSGLQSALDGKASAPHTHAASDITSGSLALERGGTGAGSASAARANLDVPSNTDLSSGLSGKSDIGHTHTMAEVTGLQSALDAKLAVDMGGEPNGYAQLDVSGKVPIEQIPVDELPTGGGGGASELDDLTDVEIDELQLSSGQVLKYNGTEFANAAMSVSDVSGLQSALDAKQDELAGIADVPGLQPALDAKQDELAGVADIPGLQSALDAKQDELAGIADVPGLQSALDAKQDELAGVADVPGLQPALDAKQATLTSPNDVPGLSATLALKQDLSAKGQANGYASLGVDGKVPAAQLPTTGGGASELDDLSDVSVTSPASGQVLRFNGSEFANAGLGISDVASLQSGLNAKQNQSEKGQANGYASLDASGKVPAAQLPPQAVKDFMSRYMYGAPR